MLCGNSRIREQTFVSVFHAYSVSTDNLLCGYVMYVYSILHKGESFCGLLVGDSVKRRPRRRKLGKLLVRRRVQQMMTLSVEFS
jgi:hypothetical protein